MVPIGLLIAIGIGIRIIRVLLEQPVEGFGLLDVHFLLIMAIQVLWNSIDLGEIYVEFLKRNGVGVVCVDEIESSIDLLFVEF